MSRTKLVDIGKVSIHLQGRHTTNSLLKSHGNDNLGNFVVHVICDAIIQ